MSRTVAGLAAVAAGAGLFAASGVGPYEVTTIRGASETLYGVGLYRFDSLLVGTGNRGADAVTLFAAVPLLVAAVARRRRGSVKGAVLLAGVLSYFAYYYVSMTFGTAQNRLFSVYVALMSLSLFAFVRVLSSIDPRRLADAFPDRPSRGALALYLFAVAGLLCLAWLPAMVDAAVTGRVADVLGPYTSAVTWALDLGVIAPAAVAAGVLVARGAPAGLLAVAVLLVLNVLIGATLIGQTVAQLIAGVPLTPAELVAKSLTFVVLSVVAAGMLARLDRGWRRES